MRRRARSMWRRVRARNMPVFVRRGKAKIDLDQAVSDLALKLVRQRKARTASSAFKMALRILRARPLYHGATRQRVYFGMPKTKKSKRKGVSKAQRAAGKRLARMSKRVAKMVKGGRYTRKQAWAKLRKKK